MANLKIAEVNCETGEVTERLMTDEEQADHLAAVKDADDRELARKAEADRVAALKESAKAKLVAGEALTEEEASVLVI
jgi:hypothetical protein